MKRKVCQKRRMLLMLIFALIFHAYPAYARTKSVQQKIVSIAQAEVGKGESAKNNCGEDIRKYLLGGNGFSWCAGFVSWVLKEAKIDILDYSLSAKSIYNQAKAKNLVVEEPKAGDLAVFWRKKQNSWFGHIGIISKADEKKIWVIEGNKGRFPAKVREFEYSKDNVPKLLGYVRIENGNDKK